MQQPFVCCSGSCSAEIHRLQPPHHILGCFHLTPHLTRATIPAILLLRPLPFRLGARPLGEAHAISSGLDCAVHQSGLSRPRSLASRPSLRSQRWFGVLPLLRQQLAGGSPAHWPTPSHEAAHPCCPPAPPPPAKIRNSDCWAAKENRPKKM